MTLTWGSLEDYAVANGIKARAVRKRIAAGKVTFRTVKSEAGGGKGGLMYQVLMDTPDTGLVPTATSLPALIGAALPVPINGPKAQQWRNFKRMVIAPAMMLEAHSKERGRVIRQLAERECLTPDGDMRRFSDRAIRSWIAAEFAAEDLARKKRKDAGERRVVISRTIDEAVYAKGLGQPDLAMLKHEIETLAKSLRVHGNMLPKTAWPRVNNHLNQQLTALKVVTGKRVELPAHLFRKWQNEVRSEDLYVNNRKAFENQRPRGRTSTAGMQPLEVVQVDATKVDVYYQREDGTPATPYMVTWQDMFTRRVFCSLFALDANKSLRNRHIIQSFYDMAQAWGLPSHVIADNGSEFKCLDSLEPGLRALRVSAGQGGKSLTRNKAYNSQAKGMVERAQGVLNQNIFRPIPGWRDSDLLKSKAANHGEGILTFPGTLSELGDVLQKSIAEYNASHQQGDLDKLPPDERFRRAVEGGFETTAVSHLALLFAFSDLEQKNIRQGYISHEGKWFCRAAAELRPTGKVWVRVPKYLTWDKLPVFLNADDKQPIGYATRAVGNHPLDQEAASERAVIAAAYERNTKAGVKRLRLVTEADSTLALPPPAIANVGGVLGLSDDSMRQVPTILEPEQDRLERETQRQIDEQEKRLAQSELFWSKVRANKSGA